MEKAMILTRSVQCVCCTRAITENEPRYDELVLSRLTPFYPNACTFAVPLCRQCFLDWWHRVVLAREEHDNHVWRQRTRDEFSARLCDLLLPRP
jgi:hypothetical protein